MTGITTCLATMPWQGINTPSLALGILSSACRSDGRPAPDMYFGNIRWAEYLVEQSGGTITPEHYLEIHDKLFHNIGEWVFAGTLNNDENFGYAQLEEYLGTVVLAPGAAWRMRELASGFIDRAAREIIALEPQVVGLTTTFQQNAASLSLARRLKTLAPGIRVVLGGANCDGPQGEALHRNFPAVDFVVRGEGEQAFPQLLQAIEDGRGFDRIPGLCWRADDGSPVANREARTPLPAGKIPVPDYDQWADAVERSPIRSEIRPVLVMETARGCWWGEVHQCTFCGLNGSSMQFRSKSPEKAIQELAHLVQRHKILDIVIVDNIIDNRFYTSFLPLVSALDWDLRVHYEVKSNLKFSHIASLRQAGVSSIQPGIESLSTRVLQLMDKGVTAAQNIRTLRDSESNHVTVSWNWLLGFPGELAEDYLQVIDQLPALVHLQPPEGAPIRIQLERFSPYFDRPELGLKNLGVEVSYRHVYNLPDRELEDIAYAFRTDPAGITGAVVNQLCDVVAAWQRGYQTSSLTRTIDDCGVHLHDRRAGWPRRDHHISDPAFIAAYVELETGRSFEALLRNLAAQGYKMATERMAAWLATLLEDGLVFEEDSRYLALATTNKPLRKML